MLERFRRFLSANWKDLVLIAILFLSPLACFADVAFLPYTFYRVDIELLQVPSRVFQAEVLKEGQLGFWNPYIFMGYPTLAEPEAGPLYPFNLIFALPIPHYYALTLLLMVHFGLAGVFAYILSRSLGIGRTGSFVSGLVFAFGGFLVAQLNNMNIFTGGIWLPLVLCLFSQALRRRSFAFAAGAGVVLAFLILPSHPQIILYASIVLGLYYVYSLLTLPRADMRSILAVSLISLTALAVGVGLAAVQLIPTYQLKGFSDLAESPGYEYVTAYSLPKFRLLSFLFPGFLGNPVVGYRGEPLYNEHHGYAGILPLILAALAWGRRRDPQVRFFGLLAILAVLLALGNETPLYHLLAHVPVYNYFRIPSRWLLVLTLSLAVLAGYGFDHLLEQRGRRPLPGWAKGLVLAAVVLTLTLPLLFLYRKQALDAVNYIIDQVYAGQTTWTLRALIRNLPRFYDVVQPNLLARTLPPLLNPILLFLLMLNASVGLILLFLGERISTRLFQILAAGLIMFDLLMAGGTNIVQVTDATHFEKRASTVYLEERVGLHRIYSPDREGAAPQKLLDYFPMVYRIQSLGNLPSVSVLTPRRYNEFLDTLRQNTRLLNLAGVKYIITELEEPPDWWHNRLQKVYDEEGVNIYENLDVMPRAFLVHQAQVPGSDEAILALLAGEEFDLSSSILLEDRSALERLESARRESPPFAGEDKVRIVEYEPNRVLIEATAGEAGFLFLSDSYYPGWRVYVDGQEEPLYRANYLFRAVLVPPGEHMIEFRFDPVAFKVGLVVTLVTLVVVVMVVVLSRRRSRSSSSPAAEV